MDEETCALLAVKLGLPEDSTEDAIDSYIAKAKATRPARTLSASTSGDDRLGYGAPEGLRTFAAAPSVAARSDAGRRVVPHPHGGYVVEAGTSARAGTAEVEDDGLPGEWFPAGVPHGRVYAG